MPALDPAQVWGCHYTTLGQGETSAAPMGLLRSAPLKSAEQRSLDLAQELDPSPVSFSPTSFPQTYLLTTFPNSETLPSHLLPTFCILSQTPGCSSSANTTHLFMGPVAQHRKASATPCTGFPYFQDGTDMPHGTFVSPLNQHKGLVLAQGYIRIVLLMFLTLESKLRYKKINIFSFPQNFIFPSKYKKEILFWL